MGKLFCVLGKSASGKDTIYRELLAQTQYPLHNVVPYTTRPIRSGEKNGETYFFCEEERVEELDKAGKIIELRTYQTVYGPWKYFTVDDGQIDLNEKNSLLIVTLEGYEKIVGYFGNEKVVPIYIEVEDGERLQRALNREKKESQPKYAEMCRRFLADCEDFSEEKILGAGITKRYYNNNIADTMKEILSDMQAYMEE